MSFTQVFGGNTIYPSDVSYLALALTEDVFLQWPLETSTGNDIVARIMDVTPTDAYSIYMPDATQTGVGQVTQFRNLGPDTITVKDFLGATLLSIDAGLTFTLYLTDNSAADGLWQSFQAGASTAQAQASALAGYGLIAQSSLLSQSQPVTVFNSDFTLGAGNRAAAFVWEGGLGTLTLPSASSVGNNWFVAVRNSGEGNLTIATQGSDDINALATLVLRPEDSATIITDGINFFTVGYGQQAVFAFDYTSINLAGEGGGDYILTGAELNRIAYSFVGEIVGNVAVILPATTQQYWVANNTTGGSYTLTIATAEQAAPVDVPRDSRGIYYCDGSDVIKADTASIALPIAINDGGTSASTAGGALINLGGTSVGIDVFTAVDAAAARVAIGAGTGDGSVTSVGVSGGSTGFSFSNSPVTTSNTMSMSGTLGVGYGGTGQTTYTDGQLLIGNSSGSTLTKASLTAGSGVSITPGAGSITIAATGSGGTVSSVDVSGGTTGLTTSGGPITTSGSITLAGTLIPANGGTGQTSFTNGQLLIGNTTGNTLTKASLTAGTGVTITPGTGSITIAATGSGGTVTSVVASTGLTGGTITATGTIAVDYTAASPWTGQQTFTGSTSVLAAKFVNALEKATVSATAATGTINYDVTTQSVLYYTSNASANWTTNLRASSGTSLDTAMATGESITVAFLVTQGATAYYNNVVQVDGTTAGVTTKWQSAVPSSGTVSSINVYTYTVFKTGSATFTVLASQTPFV